MDTLTSAAEIELDLIARTTTRTTATAAATTSPKNNASPRNTQQQQQQQQQYGVSIGTITHGKMPLEYDDEEVLFN